MPSQQANVADEAEEDVSDAAEEDVADASEEALVHAAPEGALHDAAEEVGGRQPGPGRGLRLGQRDLHRQRRGGIVKSGE